MITFGPRFDLDELRKLVEPPRSPTETGTADVLCGFRLRACNAVPPGFVVSVSESASGSPFVQVFRLTQDGVQEVTLPGVTIQKLSEI